MPGHPIFCVAIRFVSSCDDWPPLAGHVTSEASKLDYTVAWRTVAYPTGSGLAISFHKLLARKERN